MASNSKRPKVIEDASCSTDRRETSFEPFYFATSVLSQIVCGQNLTDKRNFSRNADDYDNSLMSIWQIRQHGPSKCEMHMLLKEVLERCRLCQANQGTVRIAGNDEFIRKVLDCTKLKINDEYMHVLPKSVCRSCKHCIEKFFTYLQEIRLVNQKLLDQILKKKNEVSPQSCNQRGESRAKTGDLDEASARHLKCPICPKRYSKRKNLELHKRKHPSLHCKNCNLLFNTAAECSSHACKCRAYRQDDPLLFNKTIDKLNGKIKEEPTPEVSPTEIETVDVKPKYESEENSSNEVPHKDLSGSSDSFKASRQEHNYARTFPCTYENCYKICPSANSLKTHLQKHEGKLLFLCVTCGKAFGTRNSLNSHEKIHAKVKPYRCDECNISFSVSSNLRAHQRKHHLGVRFHCSQCTREFISKCSLDRHELVHTGVKEFKCKSCKAAFYTNKELLKHQRYHQGVRSYKCDQCFKTFFEKHHLTIHTRIHTGERPYECKTCGKSFTESQKLTRHMKSWHPPGD